MSISLHLFSSPHFIFLITERTVTFVLRVAGFQLFCRSGTRTAATIPTRAHRAAKVPYFLQPSGEGAYRLGLSAVCHWWLQWLGHCSSMLCCSDLEEKAPERLESTNWLALMDGTAVITWVTCGPCCAINAQKVRAQCRVVFKRVNVWYSAHDCGYSQRWVHTHQWSVWFSFVISCIKPV